MNSGLRVFERERRIQEIRKEDVLELLDLIERGFDDIEHRISNMDKEHSKYVRATVTRLELSVKRRDRHKRISGKIAESNRTEGRQRGAS